MGIPEERTHLFEYSFVSVKIYKALLERGANGGRVRRQALLARIPEGPKLRAARARTTAVYVVASMDPMQQSQILGRLRHPNNLLPAGTTLLPVSDIVGYGIVKQNDVLPDIGDLLPQFG